MRREDDRDTGRSACGAVADVCPAQAGVGEELILGAGELGFVCGLLDVEDVGDDPAGWYLVVGCRPRPLTAQGERLVLRGVGVKGWVGRCRVGRS